MENQDRYVFQEGWVPRSHEVDYQGRVRPDALFNLFSDAAKRHAEQLGFGFETMKAAGLFWVVRQYQLEFRGVPRLDEELVLKTAPHSMQRLRAGRFFRLERADGSAVVLADSVWLLLKRDTKRPVPPSRQVEELPPDPPRLEREPLAVPAELAGGGKSSGKSSGRSDGAGMGSDAGPGLAKAEPGRAVAERIAVFSDVDIHQHVNNARYLTWCLDAVPLEIWEEHYPVFLDMTFKKETSYGDRVILKARRKASAGRFDGETEGGEPVFTLLGAWG